MKKKISIILTIVMLLSSIVLAKAVYTDLPETHWAYSAIQEMSERGILVGYPDGTFGPNNSITRAEFAKILTTALNLANTSSSSNITFSDVGMNHWAYNYVNAASNYLTGYKSGNVYFYRPDNAAVREDMAVAIVNALGLDTTNYKMSTLNQFSDRDAISNDLQKYVAIAVENGLMSGNGNGTFNPKGNLTRAEVSQLMINTLNYSEKVVIAEQNNTTGKNATNTVVLPDFEYDIKTGTIDLGVNWKDYYYSCNNELKFGKLCTPTQRVLSYNDYGADEGKKIRGQYTFIISKEDLSVFKTVLLTDPFRNIRYDFANGEIDLGNDWQNYLYSFANANKAPNGGTIYAPSQKVLQANAEDKGLIKNGYHSYNGFTNSSDCFITIYLLNNKESFLYTRIPVGSGKNNNNNNNNSSSNTGNNNNSNSNTGNGNVSQTTNNNNNTTETTKKEYFKDVKYNKATHTIDLGENWNQYYFCSKPQSNYAEGIKNKTVYEPAQRVLSYQPKNDVDSSTGKRNGFDFEKTDAISYFTVILKSDLTKTKTIQFITPFRLWVNNTTDAYIVNTTATLKAKGANGIKSIDAKWKNSTEVYHSNKEELKINAPIGENELEITITDNNNNVFQQTRTISNRTMPIRDVSVTEIKLDRTSLEMEMNQVVPLVATISPNNATNKEVTWSSSNTSVATITPIGSTSSSATSQMVIGAYITPKAVGNTIITVTTKDGQKTAYCIVTVKDSNNNNNNNNQNQNQNQIVHVESVTLNKTSLELEKGKTATLTATVLPSNATTKTVVWGSSNTKIATVINGKITANQAGTAVIKVITADGQKIAQCTVKVTEPQPKQKLTFLEMAAKCAKWLYDNGIDFGYTGGYIPYQTVNADGSWSGVKDKAIDSSSYVSWVIHEFGVEHNVTELKNFGDRDSASLQSLATDITKNPNKGVNQYIEAVFVDMNGLSASKSVQQIHQMLQPGDILVYRKGTGHTDIFAGWVTPSSTSDSKIYKYNCGTAPKKISSYKNADPITYNMATSSGNGHGWWDVTAILRVTATKKPVDETTSKQLIITYNIPSQLKASGTFTISINRLLEKGEGIQITADNHWIGYLAKTSKNIPNTWSYVALSKDVNGNTVDWTKKKSYTFSGKQIFNLFEKKSAFEKCLTVDFQVRNYMLDANITYVENIKETGNRKTKLVIEEKQISTGSNISWFVNKIKDGKYTIKEPNKAYLTTEYKNNTLTITPEGAASSKFTYTIGKNNTLTPAGIEKWCSYVGIKYSKSGNKIKISYILNGIRYYDNLTVSNNKVGTEKLLNMMCFIWTHLDADQLVKTK